MKSRKDTIMIAVLVNAAILAVLFISAVKYREDKPILSPEASSQITQPISLASSPISASASLEQVPAESIMAAEKIGSPESLSLGSQDASSSGQLDFVKELEAIARASMQPQTSVASGIQTGGETLVGQKEIAPSAGYVEVKVKKGDALAKIAKAHQTTVEEIMSHNQLKTTLLNVGQVLKIPQSGKSFSSTETSFPNSIEKTAILTDGQEPKYYTVKPGDNPWSIAAKHQIKVDQLLRLNQLTPEKARHLKPGDKLRIR